LICRVPHEAICRRLAVVRKEPISVSQVEGCSNFWRHVSFRAEAANAIGYDLSLQARFYQVARAEICVGAPGKSTRVYWGTPTAAHDVVHRVLPYKALMDLDRASDDEGVVALARA
jgi:hypothetical protein